MQIGCAMLGRFDDVALSAVGLLVSNIALLTALVFLVLLARLDLDEAAARRVPLYVLTFPMTFFLSAPYPHALFLAAAAMAMFFTRTGQLSAVGVSAALATLARVHGVLIILPLAFSLRRNVWLGLPLLTFVGFVAYALARFGQPFSSLTAGSAWGRHIAPPWEAFGPYLTLPWGDHGSLQSPLDLGFTLVLIGLVALCWIRLRRSLALFATLFLLVFLSSGQLTSIMRYGLELFPIFFVLAISGSSRPFHITFLALSSYLAVRFMSAYSSGVWIA
jgi:hypothetical protein